MVVTSLHLFFHEEMRVCPNRLELAILVHLLQAPAAVSCIFGLLQFTKTPPRSNKGKICKQNRFECQQITNMLALEVD